jgi:hypothetical protein
LALAHRGGRKEGGRHGGDATDELAAGRLGLFFLAAALAAPINHDESQYVAAIAMMRDGLPYRDWPYLQTSLSPCCSRLSLLPLAG